MRTITVSLIGEKDIIRKQQKYYIKCEAEKPPQLDQK